MSHKENHTCLIERRDKKKITKQNPGYNTVFNSCGSVTHSCSKLRTRPISRKYDTI